MRWNTLGYSAVVITHTLLQRFRNGFYAHVKSMPVLPLK